MGYMTRTGRRGRWTGTGAGMVLFLGALGLVSSMGCSKEKPIGMASGPTKSGNTATASGGAMDCKSFCKVLLRCTPEGQDVKDPAAELSRCASECEHTPPPPNQDGMVLGALRECAGKSGGDCGKFKDCSIEKMQALAAQLQPKQEDPRAVYKIPVGASPAVGAAQPLVTVVAFLDAQCHYCRKSIPVLDALLQRFKGRLRIVFKAFPLGHGEASNLAAEAGLEVYAQKGPAAYWAYIKKVFFAENLTKAAVLDAVAAVGADRAKAARVLEKGLRRKAVMQDQDLGHRFGVDGTPAFFVNGRKIPGYMEDAEFSKVVEMAEMEAKKLLASGVSKNGLYARLTEKGYDKVRYLEGPSAQPGELNPNVVFKVEVTDRMPQKGPSDALVTIVEFCDFQCPFCRRLAVTLDQLRKIYPKDLRIVFRHMPLPFHASAFIAAEASMIAFAQKGASAFWAFHDSLFQNQDDLSLVTIERIAKEIGLDISRFRKALAAHTFEARIKKELAVGEHWKIQGTPQMFINGRAVAGAYPVDDLKKIIEKRIAEAKKLLASGVSRSKLYDTIVSKGRTEPLFAKTASERPTGQPESPAPAIPQVVPAVPTPARQAPR